MASRLDAINITARDHESLGAFWRSVFDLTEDADDPNLPGDPVTVYFTEPVQIRFLFQPVEDGQTWVPRIHFDVRPIDRSREEEVERLIGRGATVVADRSRPDGGGWVTVRDADGYELCVQRQTPASGSSRSDLGTRRGGRGPSPRRVPTVRRRMPSCRRDTPRPRADHGCLKPSPKLE